MDTSDKQQLISISISLNSLLTQYISIHNAFLNHKFNIRHILPIPFLFKPIDYRDFHERAEEILEKLNFLNSQVTDIEKKTGVGKYEYISILREYISRLRKAIEKLVDILYKLYQKSQGANLYSYKQYNKDLDDYNALVQNYSNYGDMLNIKFIEFRGSTN